MFFAIGRKNFLPAGLLPRMVCDSLRALQTVKLGAKPLYKRLSGA